MLIHKGSFFLQILVQQVDREEERFVLHDIPEPVLLHDGAVHVVCPPVDVDLSGLQLDGVVLLSAHHPLEVSASHDNFSLIFG